jgi:hypothetical protein
MQGVQMTKQKPPKLKEYKVFMKTSHDFKEAAINRNIRYWNIHNCSMCGYECGFLFFHFDEFEVIYDSGCDCVRRPTKNISDWEQVAAHYNANVLNQHVIAEYNKLWGFE